MSSAAAFSVSAVLHESVGERWGGVVHFGCQYPVAVSADFFPGTQLADFHLERESVVGYFQIRLQPFALTRGAVDFERR
jgi:hypothetical protein